MKITITFQSMDHSNPMETHAREKLKKIEEFLKNFESQPPIYAEFWLTAKKEHPHHKADLHLKTSLFDLNTQDESTDMYFSIDNTIDKMIKLLKKEKQRCQDKKTKVKTEKSKFSSDKYTL